MSASIPHSKRPVNLDLLTIKQPSTAIASILHRVSGVVIFLLLPFMLYALHHSLISSEHFLRVQECFECGSVRFFIWIFFSALLYHCLAGIRHVIMDLGFGETVKVGRATATFVIVLGVIGILELGVYLW
jgi:succinate dehydrogenase / fumarate reductase cytochrome b subunit